MKLLASTNAPPVAASVGSNVRRTRSWAQQWYATHRCPFAHQSVFASEYRSAYCNYHTNIIIAFYSIIHYTDPMEPVKRTYRSTLRTEQTEVTRRRILDAARLLFARQGYQGATMDQLAEEAGVAIQTLYAAFGSKLKLAVAVIDEVLASIGIPEMARHQAGEIG